MALSATQRAARTGKLTASRIACLMTGEAEKIDRLYREMIGDEVEEDLSQVWAVRLGEATEALNLEWFERKRAAPLSRVGEVIAHPLLPWAACTIDAWSDELQCPVECKHVGGREPLEVVIARYQPQCQWQMECTGAEQCALSIIVGASEPVVEFIDRDPVYAAEMIARGAAFILCVETRRPPVPIRPAAPPIDANRTYDMTGIETWQRFAASWLQTAGAMETAKEAEKVLKSLVPADAKLAHGAGVRITRDRAGRLSLRAASDGSTA
jgi:YqaJ-like viral recombinase domain